MCPLGKDFESRYIRFDCAQNQLHRLVSMMLCRYVLHNERMEQAYCHRYLLPPRAYSNPFRGAVTR